VVLSAAIEAGGLMSMVAPSRAENAIVRVKVVMDVSFYGVQHSVDGSAATSRTRNHPVSALVDTRHGPLAYASADRSGPELASLEPIQQGRKIPIAGIPLRRSVVLPTPRGA
jgi:hypothetical protein